MMEQNNIPFRDKPIKAAYMWRDIERRAERYGLPAKLPAPYPLSQWDPVNQLAVLAAEEGWCEPYVVETYRRWFQEGFEPGHEPQLTDMLQTIGQAAHRAKEVASSPENILVYQRATNEARTAGIFGTPRFIVGKELFWGDDRLEDAIAWAKAAEPRA